MKLIYDTVYYLSFHLTKAVLTVVQRDSYLYWPYLLSTVAAACLVAWIQRSHGPGFGTMMGGYFSRRIWWHPSARADYRYYFANVLLLPLLGTALLNETRVSNTVIGWIADSLPAAAALDAQPITLRLAYTLLFFVAYDFGRFTAHSLLHDIPLLWHFHKVHHSAQVLTPMTSYRVHPIDLMVMTIVPGITTGILTAAFVGVTGAQVTVFTYLGLHVVLFAINLVDNLRHSHVWLTYGTRLGRWIVSPAHHQLHHSCEERHIGCNRGFTLAVWDRLYGTLRVPEAEPEVFRMGLGDGTDERWQSVWRMYWQPFADAWKAMATAMRMVRPRHP